MKDESQPRLPRNSTSRSSGRTTRTGASPVAASSAGRAAPRDPGAAPRTRGTPDTDDRDFLATYDAAAFPHPSVAVDVAIVTVTHGALHALLVRRAEPPQRGRLALPGGFVRMDESLDAAAARILAAKARLRGVWLEQLYTFGEPSRDPRTRVISVAYYALVDAAKLAHAAAGGDVVLVRLDVPWDGEAGGAVRAAGVEAAGGAPLALAFDHAEILGTAVKRLRGKLDYAPIGFQLLPPEFTLRQLQEIHEAVLGRRLNKDSFRRSVVTRGLVTPTGKMERDVPYRPAELHRYARPASTGTHARH